MKRFLFVFLFSVFSLQLFAQPDKLYVEIFDYGWNIIHKVKPAETIFSIARKYHVPPAMLADKNGMNFQTSVQSKENVLVPVGAYNFITSADQQITERIPLYYKVEKDISLYRVSKCSRVAQKNIQQWNGLFNTEVSPGTELIIGWVLYDATDITTPPSASNEPAVSNNSVKPKSTTIKSSELPKGVTSITTIIIPKKDSLNRDSLLANAPDTSEAAKMYREQTFNEQSVTTEKGSAVFYPSSGVSSGFYYAFHATVKKGKIIKVYNPGTEKTIYVKVLGPLPKTEMYYNSIIGISSSAKEALGLKVEDKTWCEISYAP